MKRTIGFVALAALVGLVSMQTMVSAQDKVDRRDKKGGTITVSGKILEESAAGVKIKPAGVGKEEVIPSGEVVRVAYGEFPLQVSLALGKLAPLETARDYPALLTGFEAVQAMPEAKTVPAPAKRYLDYRVVTLKAYTAESEAQVKAAIQGLTAFAAANADTWEYPHVARQLGRLQADTGDYPSATKTFEALKKAPTVPAEFKQDATAALIDIAFQSNDFAAGKARVEEIAKDAGASPALKARVEMYQLALAGVEPSADPAAAVKKIQDAIDKTNDPSLKALGYNVLGDVYSAKNQKRDAMWSYLWVDVVYNQDRGEHLKAMTRLLKMFEVDDKEKAAQYKEKIARSR